MTKNIDDMIVPEKRRSIRNIPIPEGRRKNHKLNGPETASSSTEETTSAPATKFDDFHAHRSPSQILSSSGGKSKKGLWWSAVMALLVIIFVVLSIFDGATLSYAPKSGPVSFNNNLYTASKGEGGKLLYSIIKLSLNRAVDVPASGENEVSRKASGTIIVYNTGSQSQRLRATTRFETPDKKVYQVEDAITVPAASTVGGVEKPGTLEIVVQAEFPGEAFNIGLADFTLPGLEGTSLFSSIYARSKTEISGGFVGTEKVVSSTDESKAEAELKTLLREALISEATAQVPDGFVLIPSLSSVTFETLPQTNSTNKNSAKINMRGNFNGVMFKSVDLSTSLALERVPLNPDETVDILGLESLDFSLSSTTTDLLTASEISFTVSGEATTVWRTDEVALKADLMGKSKKELPAILGNYPAINTATATIRPFWKRSFPDDSKDILIRKVSAE